MLCERFTVSERRVCRLLRHPLGTQRYIPTLRTDEAPLTQAIIGLACEYGRYGYRRVTPLLHEQGWQVSVDRVERIWRREGLKVPMKQPKRGRLWLNEGSCVRLRPEHPNHVWSYDFVHDRTHDGRTLRLLTLCQGRAWMSAFCRDKVSPDRRLKCRRWEAIPRWPVPPRECRTH